MKKIIIERLWDRFIFLVKKYLKENQLTQGQLAEIVDMQRSHLCALLNKAPKRKLSVYYLFKFIQKGIIKVSEIYDEKAENKREIDFWKQAREAENMNLLAKIARIREHGTDVEKFLEIHFPGI